MSYSFYFLHKEERLFGVKLSSENRSIMSEKEIRSMPVMKGELDSSPYFTEIYSATDEKLRTIIPMYLHGRRAFVSRDEFKRRLSIMSGDMLNNINLAKYGAYLTGSSLVPCIVTNPLEDNFTTYEEPFKQFVEAYYPSYISLQEHKSYIDKGMSVSTKQDVPASLGAIEEFIRNQKESSALVYEHISAFKEKEKFLTDMDIAVMNQSVEEFDTKVLSITGEIRKNITGRVYLKKIPTKFGYKWCLKGPGARRPIDFFPTRLTPHALTSRFHMNIVRFWWDGIELKGLSSGVAAALSGTNQWYRWFSNNKDPINIVLKYMQRGYTTLLNNKEFMILRKYIDETDKYRFIRDKLVTGKIGINHPIFTLSGGIRFNIPLPSYCNDRECHHYWPDRAYTMTRMVCSIKTNSNGKIVPPKIFALESIIDDLMDST